MLFELSQIQFLPDAVARDFQYAERPLELKFVDAV